MATKRRSIADVYVSIVPETARLAGEVARAFRSTDREAREAGRRWAREINEELRNVHVNIDADTREARRKSRELTRDISGDFSRVGGVITKTLAGAVAGGLAGLAVTGGGGGLIALTSAASQASGVLGLLPATIGGVAAAVGTLKLATSGFADAIKDVGDPKKFAAAIQDLAPSAQQAALAIKSVMPELEGLKKATEGAFFQGFSGQIQALTTTYLPMVQQFTMGVASSMSTAINGIGDLLRDPSRFTDISSMTASWRTGFDTLAQAAQPVVKALLDVGTVGSGFFPQIAASIKDAAQGFSQFIANARETGQLQLWISSGIEAAKTLGGVLVNVGGTIHGIFTAGDAVGGGLLASLQKVTDHVNQWVNSGQGQNALGTLFEGVKQALDVLLPILSTVAQSVLGTILPAFTQLAVAAGPALQSTFTILAQIMQALAPVLVSLSGPISTLLGALGPAIQQTITALAPAIEPLASAFASLIAAAAPILPVLGQLVGAVVGALAPALKTLFDALAPVIQQLVSALQPVIQALAPVLAQCAMIFAQAWASALQELTPLLGQLLQSMGGLLIAIMPLLPQIAQLGVQALPVLADALQIALPILTRIVEIFTNLAKVVVPILVKVIGSMVQSWKAAFGAVKDAVKSAWEFIKPIFDKISGAFESIKSMLVVIPGVGAIIGGGGSPSTPATAPLAPPPAAAAAPAALTPLYKGSPTMFLSPGAALLNQIPQTLAPMPGVGPTQTFDVPAPPPPKGTHSHSSVAGAGGIPGLASESGLTPNAVSLNRALTQSFPQLKSIGGWRQPDGFNEHSSGEALDVMIPDWNTPEGKALGDQISQWLLQNADAFGVRYTLWQQSQHNPDGSSSGMENRGGATANHMDHVHVRVKPGASSGAGFMPPSSLSPGSVIDGSMIPSTSGAVSGGAKTLRDAEQRVADREESIRQAQLKIDELPDDASQSRREAAEYRLAKAKREHADAINDLAAAQQKYNGTAAKQGESKTGDLAQQFGKEFGSGLLEMFGFDGTLFKDPSQFGLVKLLGSFSKLKFNPDAIGGGGGVPGAAAPAGGGGGGGDVLGGLLSNMPSPFGKLNIGSQADAPVPFIQMPDGSGSSAMLPGSQFAPGTTDTAPGGGGGNTYINDQSVDMRGAQMGANKADVDNVIRDRQISQQRAQPMVRPLPQ
ncbi:MAG: phage tail protein [Mycobacterium sp.]